MKQNRCDFLIKLIFFGNYFYGICAVALAIEANMQLGFPLNNGWFYGAIFAGTVAYYTYAYTGIGQLPPNPGNVRSVWYAQNRVLVGRSQWVMLALVAVYSLFFIWQNGSRLAALPPGGWTGTGSSFGPPQGRWPSACWQLTAPQFGRRNRAGQRSPVRSFFVATCVCC